MAGPPLSTDLLAHVLHATPAVLLVVDVEDGCVRYRNATARAAFGETLTEGGPVADVTHPDDLDALQRLVDAGADGHARIRLRHEDGVHHTYDVATRAPEAGNGSGLVVLCCVAARRPAANVRHDDLTQLPNRAAFIERLQRSLGRARQRVDYSFAVLVIDLDRFSLINNTLGDSGGDHVLRMIAERLRGCLRPADMVARIGADQFAIIADNLRPDVDSALEATRVAERIQANAIHELEGTTRELMVGATRVAQRIQQHALGSPFELGAQEVFASASIGIALSQSDYELAEEMFRDADVAMHRAKAAGGSRYELFDRRMHARIAERLSLESDLHRALERSQFRLYYQPIVALDDLRITGFECLLRWEHPRHGLLAPDQFIRVAEEMGVLLKLSSWLVREACLQVKAWRETGPERSNLSVSVNLASGSFESGDLLRSVGRALEETGTQSGLLELELTESAMVSNFEATAETLGALKGLGVDVHIDDFGTGYSSLSYIHRLPISAIKIDQSFTARLPDDADTERLMRTIVELGHNLKRTVVAEGIETDAQLECVRRLGCDRGQGFLFSPPVDVERVPGLLEQPPWRFRSR